MSVKKFVSNWYSRHLNQPEAVALLLFLWVMIIALYFLGSILLPLLMALVLAYLLEWPVASLERFKVPRLLSVIIVFSLFISLLVLTAVGLVPILKHQLSSLLNSLPEMFAEGKKLLMSFQKDYPYLISESQYIDIVDSIKNYGTTSGTYLLSFSLASISNILTIILYLVLVPILVFFLLKDKNVLAHQANMFMPEESTLIYKVFDEVHIGLGNYIRGKFLEAVIVSISTAIVLKYFNLPYNALLSVLVGISVFFPFVGTIVCTVPIALVGMFHLGLGSAFVQMMIAYTLVQVVDAQLLVPIILAEALNMRTIFIILSIILFGGLFGFWGVVFAIPLAILIRAIINLWPSMKRVP